MADSINIPQHLTQVVKIEVKDTSDQLRRFLIDMAIRLDALEKKNAALEIRVTNLGG